MRLVDLFNRIIVFTSVEMSNSAALKSISQAIMTIHLSAELKTLENWQCQSFDGNALNIWSPVSKHVEILGLFLH